jgi:hypothetical protein
MKKTSFKVVIICDWLLIYFWKINQYRKRCCELFLLLAFSKSNKKSSRNQCIFGVCWVVPQNYPKAQKPESARIAFGLKVPAFFEFSGLDLSHKRPILYAVASDKWTRCLRRFNFCACVPTCKPTSDVSLGESPKKTPIQSIPNVKADASPEDRYRVHHLGCFFC